MANRGTVTRCDFCFFDAEQEGIRTTTHSTCGCCKPLVDITANVDFTAVAKAAVVSDFEFSGYTSQTALLLASDLDHIFSEQIGEDEQRRLE